MKEHKSKNVNEREKITKTVCSFIPAEGFYQISLTQYLDLNKVDNRKEFKN